MAEKSSQDFIIKDTAFSTVTVNKNFRTAGHYDNGDLKEGFGNLGVISKGEYDGAITVIPRYGIGLDLKNGDLAIFDVHELHGNTETTTKSFYERISIVCYYREKMIYCGDYEGSITVIPKYGIGLDLKNGDLAIFDVHELHGNTETTTKSFYERISVVCYYREKMIYCGNADYELNRAKTNTKKVADEEELKRAKLIKDEILNESKSNTL